MKLLNYWVEILAGLAFLSGVGLLLHQSLVINQGWFAWEQFFNQLNHEALIVISFVAFIALIVGKYSRRR